MSLHEKGVTKIVPLSRNLVERIQTTWGKQGVGAHSRAACTSQAKLLDAILACSQLGRRNAEDGDHGHATVVELSVPNVVRVATAERRKELLPVARVPEVARLLGETVLPVDGLEET